MTQTARPEVERALEQVLRLVNLVGDLQRNASDAEFARVPGNDVISVIDENVFEMFIRPFRYSDAAETFYAEAWALAPLSESDRQAWHGFEAQAALITAEFLLSRKGSDARANFINMTEFHRFELLLRLEHNIEELLPIVMRGDEAYTEELGRRLQIFATMFPVKRKAGRLPSFRSESALLNADIDGLGSRLDDTMKYRIRAARMAAALLAKSQFAEPYDQIKRLMSPAVQQRLKTLENEFPPSPQEATQIDREAEQWFSRLKSELEKPGHRERRRAKSVEYSVRPLWNDARSIAYLRWVARRKLDKGQRLVFVTGDEVLFDAYRRWYFLSKGAHDTNEPFFLRRVTQFTPIFNPVETGGDLARVVIDEADRMSLFSLIEQAVEANLLALQGNKQEVEPATAESITSQSREALGLKLVDCETLAEDHDLEPLAKAFSDGWVEKSTASIRRNQELWQRLHRLSIGTSYDLVAQRVDDEQRELADNYVSSPSSDAARILKSYASGVLNELLDNSIHLWLELAERFRAGHIRDLSWRRPQIKRVSIAVELPAAQSKPAAEPDAGAPADPDGVERRPEVVFAEAALQAIELQDISNAYRFADMAARSDAAMVQKTTALPGLMIELRYLNAVTNRLMITTSGAHLRSAGKDEKSERLAATRSLRVVAQAFRRASTLLDDCFSAHFERAGEDEYHAIRYLRTLSERASLHLFMATSTGLTHQRYHDLLEYDPVSLLDIARGDLRRCIELDLKLDGSTRLLDTVRSQFIPNIAGYEVMAFLAEPHDYKPQEWQRKALRQLDKFWENESNPHPLLAAELAAYYSLSGRSQPKGRQLVKAENWAASENLRLSLDRHLFRAVHKRILDDKN